MTHASSLLGLAQSQSGRASSGELSRASSGAAGGGGSSLGARMQSTTDSAGLRRMSIQEEVAQQELDEVARKNDADFEALLSKACAFLPARASCLIKLYCTAPMMGYEALPARKLSGSKPALCLIRLSCLLAAAV